jgi:hypothetical protein
MIWKTNRQEKLYSVSTVQQSSRFLKLRNVSDKVTDYREKQ